MKPCPFCGARTTLVLIRPVLQGCSVVCINCRAVGPVCINSEAAVRAWNIRYDVLVRGAHTDTIITDEADQLPSSPSPNTDINIFPGALPNDLQDVWIDFLNSHLKPIDPE